MNAHFVHPFFDMFAERAVMFIQFPKQEWQAICSHREDSFVNCGSVLSSLTVEVSMQSMRAYSS